MDEFVFLEDVRILPEHLPSHRGKNAEEHMDSILQRAELAGLEATTPVAERKMAHAQREIHAIRTIIRLAEAGLFLSHLFDGTVAREIGVTNTSIAKKTVIFSIVTAALRAAREEQGVSIPGADVVRLRVQMMRKALSTFQTIEECKIVLPLESRKKLKDFVRP